MARHPFLDAFIPEAGDAAADDISQAVESYTPLTLGSIGEITTRSLARTKLVTVVSGGQLLFYKQDAESTAEEDGYATVWDSDDLPFVLIGALTLTGAGKNGQVAAVDLTDSDPAAGGYTNGATIGGAVVATGQVVLRASASHMSRNGLWVIAASGGAARWNEFDTMAELAGARISVTGGTYANTFWLGAANPDDVLGTDDVPFAQIAFTAPSNLASKGFATAMSIIFGG